MWQTVAAHLRPGDIVLADQGTSFYGMGSHRLPEGVTFQQLLKESGLAFVPVPGMPSHKPSASFKLPGSETLAVDLLVPGNRAGEVVRFADYRGRGHFDARLARPDRLQRRLQE